MKSSITALLEKARNTSDLSHKELVRLLSLSDDELPALMAAADEVRQKTVGNQVHLRVLLNFQTFVNNIVVTAAYGPTMVLRRYRLITRAGLRKRCTGCTGRLPHLGVAKRRRPFYSGRNHC